MFIRQYLLFLILSLRSRSVVRIHANIRFEPSKINIFNKDCRRGGKDVTCMSAIVCLNITARTAIKASQEVGESSDSHSVSPSNNMQASTG